MFTILWLIRSKQGMLSKYDKTIWQHDWFFAVWITFITVGIDIFVIGNIILLF